MKLDLLMAQVQALRSQCEALLVLTAEMFPLPDTPAPTEACEHPEDERVNTSTLRGPRTFYCKRCRQEIEEQPP